MNERIPFGDKVSKALEVAKSDKAGLVGIVKSWQTDLKGKYIPGTLKEDRNTIQDGLKKYLAACIGPNAVDKKLGTTTSPFFDQDYGAGGDAMSAAIDGKSGIVYYDTIDQVATATFYTELNAGGTGGEAYIEFYGYISGAINMYGLLILGHSFTHGAAYSDVFQTKFAEYAIDESVAADRKYHFYWKITIG